jgi:hypothetical protein
MLYTILQERFVMANLIKNANLEIEKAKAISDKRLEGLRRYKQANSLFQEKYQKLESALGQLGQGGQQVSVHISGLLGEFKSIFSSDISTFINDDEPMRIFGDIHGSGEDFTRLQGLYREATYNVELLREKLVASEKARVTTGTSGVDHTRTIDALRSEITAQQEEIRRLRSQSSVSGGSNIQEYETKIRTLQSRIQDLESQNRTQKLDFDNQIRSYISKIENLERQIKLTNTPKSEVSNSTNVLSSGYTPVASGTQNFGTTSVTTPQKGGSSYGTGYTPTYTSGNAASVSTPGTTQPKPNTGGVAPGESNYPYSSSSSSVTTPNQRATGTTYSSNYGATTSSNTYGATGATGTTTGYSSTTYGATGATGTGTYGTSSGLGGSGVRTSGAVSGVAGTSSVSSSGNYSSTLGFGATGNLSGSGTTSYNTGKTTGTGGYNFSK